MRRTKRVKPSGFEEKLIEVARRLPPERIIEVIDFAQFLEASAAKGGSEDEEMSEEDARWEALLSSPKSRKLLEKMADEALAERKAGRTRSIMFTKAGKMAPG